MSFVNMFRNLSLEDIRTDGIQDSEIFSKLNIQTETRTFNQEERKTDKIRDEILPFIFNKIIIGAIFITAIILICFTSVEIGGMFVMCVVMVYTYIMYYPQIKEDRNYSDLNRELPYALRHMSIELKSGKGLHETMQTIKNADYGSLSREFNRVLEEVKFGSATEDSLMEMSKRVNSEGLSRAIHQIIGTLRVGGNLANSLEVIAEDISFDMQIKLKEYSQKLNSFILIYTFIAILAPVITLIMLMAGSTVMGDIISTDLLFVIYLIFFPLTVVFMGAFIKKLEPKI